MMGKFCAIAHGVKFMANCNHQMDGFSTYPFLTFSKDWRDAYNPKFPNKGDIVVIGNDVWLGHNALMMPGVKISDGAIIDRGSVVTNDVTPYCVVAGNPARLLKRRFFDDAIKQLLQISWRDWQTEKITKSIKAIV